MTTKIGETSQSNFSLRPIHRPKPMPSTAEMTMPGIKGIGHAVLNVENLARSRAFYVDLLGMQVVTEAGAFPGCFLSFGTRDHDLAQHARILDHEHGIDGDQRRTSRSAAPPRRSSAAATGGLSAPAAPGWVIDRYGAFTNSFSSIQ